STDAGVSILAQTPVLGRALAGLMLGGQAVGENALTRFHAAHVTLLPAVLMLLLVAHIWVARRQQEGTTKAAVPLYPDLLISAGTTLVLLLCIFAVLAILLPVPLDVRADPSARLSDAKPGWYLLSLYSLAQWIPRPVAAIVPIALTALFALVPVLDRGQSTDPRQRALALIAGGVVIAVIASLTLVGLAL
ncbi:MAG: cytochrome b N-terminal domain-containing protein, partial [Coriobacteriales bacterium]|nr:cytochrome b N-terminal domain-containing protein [Coriobacteriales bacterium]